MFGRPANPYDEVVAKATDEKQTEINWEVALNVCDKVNDDGETGARNCVAAIQKRFTHRSANVQLFSLTLAGALVNNCSGSLHREISGKAFTQALVRLVNDRTTHDTVKKEALKQIETWVKEHPNNTDFDLLVETYEALKRQGHNFHPERPPTPKGPSDDLLRREEEELQRALAESAALADPRRNYQPSSSSARARSPSPVPSAARPSASSRGPSFVRGLYDFEGESSDELPFRRGDTIRVLEKVSEEWWRGELRGRTGIFPTNYIEELPEDFNPAGAPLAAATAAAGNPDAAEAEIFAQAAAVDKLLALMHQLRARGEDFADNEELTDLYNSSMALRPKVVQLIHKYEQKQADLQAMHEKVDRARTTYEQMAGMHSSHGYAQPNGYAAPPQHHQPHPSADPYGRPLDAHGASPYHHPPSSYHQQPPHAAAPPLAQQHQPPPQQQQQQQQQYQQAPPPASAEDEAQREYERQMAEYQQKLAEYNAQVAALQAAGSPAPGPAGPAPSGEQPHPDAHQYQQPQQHQQQSQSAQQQAPQPVWDAQTGAWVWPAQSAAPPPPHEGAPPAPALSPAPAQGYPSQTQPYGLDGASSPPPAHGQRQPSQGYPLAEHMAQLSVGAGSPPLPQAYAQGPYGASATSPPPVQHGQPHPGSPHQHGAPPAAAQPASAAYYAQQGGPPPPQQQQADEQQAAWAAWHAQQQQQQQGPGGTQAGYPAGPGSAGGR